MSFHPQEWMTAAFVTLVFSSAVRALPVPKEGGNPLYFWLYNFTHGLLANWDKVGNGKH